jgi:hypothetical protein
MPKIKRKKNNLILSSLKRGNFTLKIFFFCVVYRKKRGEGL